MSSYQHQPEHLVQETTKQIIQDCCNEKTGQVDISDSRYLLRIRESKEAVLYFFNPAFSSITHDLKFEYLRNRHCMDFAAKGAVYRILVLGKKSIDLYRCKINTQGYIKQNFERLTFMIQLDQGQEFVYLSQPVDVTKHEVYIAYTNKDQFYLITLTVVDKSYNIQCIKLIDSDERKGIFSWFRKPAKPHFQTVQLQLINSSQIDKIHAVCVRQTKLTILQVEIKPAVQHPKLRVIKESMPFHESITKGYTLNHLFLIGRQQGQGQDCYLKFMAVYNKDQGYDLFKVEVKFTSGEFNIICHSPKRHKLKDLSLARFKDSTFISIYYDRHYLIYQCSEAELQSLDFSIKPLYRSTNKIYFSKSSNGLYLVSGLEISKLTFEQSQKINLLDELSNSYKSKIYKQLQVEQYHQILLLFSEEYYELVEQAKDNKDSQFAYKIICIYIMRKILESEHLSTIKQYEYDNVNPLKQACREVSNVIIRFLLKSIADQMQYSFLIDDILSALVLEFIKNQNTFIQISIAKTVIADLTNDALQSIIADLNTDEGLSKEDNRKLYILLLAYMAEFVTPMTFTVGILEKILNYNPRDIRNLIMSKHFENCFIEYFSGDQIDFDATELHQMAEYLSALQDNRLQEFLKELLKSCHKHWSIKKQMKLDHLSYMKAKSKVIVKGLLEFSQEVVPHLKDTFPGLAYLFYLKQGLRRFKVHEICDLSEQTASPSTAYIMNLSVSDVYLNERLPILVTNKLCREFEQKNYTAEQLIVCLKQMVATGIKVRRKVWQEWKELHPQHGQQAEEIERNKLQLID